MSIAEIKKLPIREKFQIMEALWDEMRPEIEAADIPEAHKAILDDCHARVASGQEALVDWSIAKNRFGNG